MFEAGRELSVDKLDARFDECLCYTAPGVARRAFHPNSMQGDEPLMAQQKYRVSDKAPNGLFLRSAPDKNNNQNKITVLPMGHPVTKKAQSAVPKWWEVSTTVQGTGVDGFLNSDFLVPDSAFVAPPAVSGIAPAHLHRSAPTTRSGTAHAYPLNEPGQPTRDPNASAPDKAKKLTEIVNWLDVEKKARYLPNSKHTYCNIYAYDYCYLAGVYLPRVWWTSSALSKLKDGKTLSPIYGSTVHELNANSLFEWLKEHGPSFGWNRTFDFTAMQNAANSGQVVVICGANKVPNKSGHITAVVPETATQKATRSGASVTRPLQSQAGVSNQKYLTKAWWTLPSFRDWGYWINMP